MDVTVEMDRFGRVLLPKKLRTALNLAPGQKLHLTVEAGGLRLEPEYREAHLRMQGEHFVLDILGLSIDGDPVEELRQQRERDVLGEW